MSPQERLQEMLEQYGAVPIRQKNHFVYRLPNGRNFVAAKTPSDRRSILNNISDLRRASGEVRAPLRPPILEVQSTSVETSMPKKLTPTPTPAPIPEPVAVAAVKPPQPPTPKISLRERIEESAKTYDAEQERLMGQAQDAEKAARMLRSLSEHADEAWAEPVLASLFFTLTPPEPEPPPPPPEPVVERAERRQRTPEAPTVNVSVSEVIAAIRRLPNTFTSKDILLQLAPDPDTLEHIELRRVQQAISGILNGTASSSGLVHCIQRGQGRRPATWERVDMGATGTRVSL